MEEQNTNKKNSMDFIESVGTRDKIDKGMTIQDLIRTVNNAPMEERYKKLRDLAANCSEVRRRKDYQEEFERIKAKKNEEMKKLPIGKNGKINKKEALKVEEDFLFDWFDLLMDHIDKVYSSGGEVNLYV